MAITTPTVWKALTKANTTDTPGAFANALATNEQSHAKIVGLAGGGSFVAWEDWSTAFSGLEPRDIVGQFFDVLGNKVGTEVYVSSIYQDLDQQAPALAALPSGSFIGVYQTDDAAGFGDLQNIAGAVFGLNATISSRNDDFREGPGAASVHNDTAPAITSFADGSYALTFENDAAGNKDLSAYIVSATGVKGSEVKIETSAANAIAPDTATLANQNFVVAYQLDNATSDIAFAIRTSANAGVTTGIVANTGGQETGPQVAALTGGGFVVAYNDSNSGGAGNAGIKARVYSSSGLPLAAAFSVETTKAGIQDQAAVSALADGGFLVAWRDVSSKSILGQRFDAASVAVGSEFTVAALHDVSLPDLTLLSDGRVMVTVTDNNAGNKDVYSVILDPRSSVTGTGGSDTLTSRIDGASVFGLAGVDTLLGFGGNDTLDGGAGLDTLNGGLGNDTYVLGAENDVVMDSGGNDTITSAVTRNLTNFTGIENITLLGSDNVNAFGDAAANVLTGNSGNNVLEGGTGADQLTGGLGNDAYYLRDIGPDGRVVDTITELANQGTDGVQTSVTVNLNEARFANIENGYVIGTVATNLGGNAANNVLVGNDAANSLYGLGGRDVMRGGLGADKFVYLFNSDTGKTAVTRDLIQDFTPGTDKIDLSALDANGAAPLNGTFQFQATQGAAFTGVAGQLHYFASAGNTIIEGDFNGDKVADFQIELTGLKTLLGTDFVL